MQIDNDPLAGVEAGLPEDPGAPPEPGCPGCACDGEGCPHSAEESAGQPAAPPTAVETAAEPRPDRPVLIAGIRFRRASKVYYFGFEEGSVSPDEVEVGDQVLVQTVSGPEVGRVVIAPRQVMESELEEPLKPVLRRLILADLHRLDSQKALERKALEESREKVTEHNLPMKLVAAQYNFDRSRLTIFFTSEGRVDFRALVRDLAAYFRTRIELRQIGVRDEARLIGGLGRCGRALCCCSFLDDFSSVSIRMAKEQDLPLNPMKISGACGRLLCCLGYETETYRRTKEMLPGVGARIDTRNGPGVVRGVNVPRESVFVTLDSGGSTIEVKARELGLGDPELPPMPEPTIASATPLSIPTGPEPPSAAEPEGGAAVGGATEPSGDRKRRRRRRRPRHRREGAAGAS